MGYRQIKDFPAYYINTDGDIYSEKSNKILKHYLTGEPRKLYEAVGLYKDNRKHEQRIHRLVLEAFVGQCPKGMEGCHNDGNQFNNKLSNLRWDTPSNNTKDSIKHGTAVCIRHGEKSSHHKLNNKEVKELRELWVHRIYPQYKLAVIYNVHVATINRVINNRSWR